MIQRANHDIEIYRGDTPKFTYQLVQMNVDTGEEEPVSLAAYTITAQVRRGADSAEVWYQLPIEKTDSTNGVFSWQLTKADSENLLLPASPLSDSAVYDIQLETNGAVFTFIAGTFKVLRDTTRG
ncbi:immunoglobulin domain-containing family protein [Enterovibrio calviensis]|uniref:hypothetical protein n=1 Tax=Enterovibrio calviensis TaxID=91359 RepID=UPI0004851C31|nr:hypothetical protein [Enterovibrio calviensis]